MLEIKQLKPNTMVYFLADYDDDDGSPAKGRRHLVVGVDRENNKVLLLKITSKRKKLHQVTIGLTKCLDKISHSNLNRKLFFSLDFLVRSNYQNFYLCPFHSEGCLKKELFQVIQHKLQKYWDNRFHRDKEEKWLDYKLKVPNKFPQKWEEFYPSFNSEGEKEP